MESVAETFEGMTQGEADGAVDALSAMLGALPADDADPVDRATRAGLEGFVLGYRIHCA